MRIANLGIELDGGEQLIWAKANTRTNLSLSGADLEAIIAEHTEPADDGDPEWRKIPAVDFERAGGVLGLFILRSVALLNSDILPDADSLAAVELRSSIQTASAIEDAINDNVIIG